MDAVSGGPLLSLIMVGAALAMLGVFGAIVYGASKLFGGPSDKTGEESPATRP